MNLLAKPLTAFKAVVEHKSFSVAAEKLGLTQGAVSQQVAKLEKDLKCRLFWRQGSQIELTEKGFSLWRFVQRAQVLAGEFESEIFDEVGQSFKGRLKILAGRTLINAPVQTALAGLLKKHPQLEIEIVIHEDQNPVEELRAGRFDFFLGNRVLDSDGIGNYVLGTETYVLCSDRKGQAPANTYLDFSEKSSYLLSLLRREGERAPNVQRRFFPEMSSLIEALECAAGRAILPRHLLKGRAVQVIDSWSPVRLPVVLNFVENSHMTKLETAVIGQITENAAKLFT